jgi:ABC-type nitrate/sulfonate/bicarbonate transport system substrate-binding protein
MKKSIWLGLMILLVVSLVLAACSQEAPTPVIQEVEVTREVEVETIVTQEVEVETIVTQEVEVVVTQEVEVLVTEPPPEPETTIWFGAGSTLLDPYLVPVFTIGRENLAEKGINLEFVALSTDEAVEAALDRDRIDVGLLSAVGLNRAVSQGLDMKFITGLETQNTFVLTTRADVENLEQLRDSAVATQARTSLSVAVAEVMMEEEAGLVSGEDYEMVFLPGSDNRAAAMEAGTIDAAVLFRNVAAQLEERSGGEFKIYGGLWDVLPPMMWEGLAVSSDFVANNPEVAQIFVETMLESFEEFYAGDPAEMAAMKEGIPEAEPLDTDALIGDYELFQSIELYPLDGGLDEESYTAITDFLVEVGQLEPDQVVPYEEAVDTSLLEAIQN